jgi:hypothetical protein
VWSCVKELKAAVVGRGIDSLMLIRRGNMSSIESSSGGATIGENTE